MPRHSPRLEEHQKEGEKIATNQQKCTEAPEKENKSVKGPHEPMDRDTDRKSGKQTKRRRERDPSPDTSDIIDCSSDSDEEDNCRKGEGQGRLRDWNSSSSSSASGCSLSSSSSESSEEEEKPVISQQRASALSSHTPAAERGGLHARLRSSLLAQRTRQLPRKHAEEKARLGRSYEEDKFAGWLESLELGASLCLHGYGSKRKVLERFGQFCRDRKEGTVLWVLDGADCLLNVEAEALRESEKLERLLRDREREREREKGKRGEMRGAWKRLIRRLRSESFLQSRGIEQLTVMVHSADGPGTRSFCKELSELASIPRVALVFSVDNVRFPLLWINFQTEQMNLLFDHVPTFEDFRLEIESGGWLYSGRGEGGWDDLGHQEGGRSLASLESLLPHVTKRAREVFACLATASLESESSSSSSSSSSAGSGGGVEERTLLDRCRAMMGLTDIQALRGLLREFRDHGVVREGSKRGTLVIDCSREVLKEFVEKRNGTGRENEKQTKHAPS